MPKRGPVLESDLDSSSAAKGLHRLPVGSLRHCTRRDQEWCEQERNDSCVCHNGILLITSKRNVPACDSYSSVTSPGKWAASNTRITTPAQVCGSGCPRNRYVSLKALAARSTAVAG